MGYECNRDKITTMGLSKYDINNSIYEKRRENDDTRGEIQMIVFEDDGEIA